MINSSSIPRLGQINQTQFTNDFLNVGQPVVLTNITKDWDATKKWSFDYLSDVAGDNIVPVYNSSPAKDNEHQHAAAKNIQLREYLLMLKNGEKDLRMFFYNILNEAPELLEDFSYPDIGMKFFKRLPVLFVGGKGAKVQMHYDIDLANLLLCHFGGKKRVLLIPPEQTKFMYKVPYSFSSLFDVDFSQPDFEKFPALSKLKGYTTELNHGDALFIPSGYWHYITYEDMGFSMTLRSFPQTTKQRMTMLKNIFITRTIEGLMRRFQGQKWNDRNEKLAIDITHQNLKN